MSKQGKKIPIHYIIRSTYSEDDPEFMGDAGLVELVLDTTVILSGDWYHDKIDDQIKGYLKAVEDLTGVKPKVTEEKNANGDW